MKREKVQRHRGPSTPREVSSLGSTIHEELEADSRCPKATPGLPPHKLSSGPGWSRHGTQTTPALGLPGPCGVQATEQARTLAPSSLPPRPGMSSAPHHGALSSLGVRVLVAGSPAGLAGFPSASLREPSPGPQSHCPPTDKALASDHRLRSREGGIQACGAPKLCRFWGGPFPQDISGPVRSQGPQRGTDMRPLGIPKRALGIEGIKGAS